MLTIRFLDILKRYTYSNIFTPPSPFPCLKKKFMLTIRFLDILKRNTYSNIFTPPSINFFLNMGKGKGKEG
jgi:hypothetical protein